MWQRFTERARRVVFYAQEEATKHGDGHVDVEHVLLGLIHEEDTVAGRVLRNLGFDATRIRQGLEKAMPVGGREPAKDVGLAPRAKRVIDLAYDEARNLNNNYIGTEHLLLGVIRLHDSRAGQVLSGLGIDLEAARRETIKLQDEATAPEAPAAQPPAMSALKKIQASHPAKIGPEQTLCMLTGGGLRPHLMITLISDVDSKPAKVVARQCQDMARLHEVLWMLIKEESKIPCGQLPKPENLDKLLVDAQAEAGTAVVSPEHLLFALLRESDGPFARVLREAGISLDESRRLAAVEAI
ncbi:MAG TPA: Clp protease N-terminal domain-containing protein [Fimbriimonadaceae bacterium]|nr:Clp protease N-terminal domain-containing protein [Fimbriimonadaceae bacterium]